MKVTYWTIECLNDSSAYDIRARTKKEALEKLELFGQEGYDNVVKRITMRYNDGFELLDHCLGEDRGICLTYKGEAKQYPIQSA